MTKIETWFWRLLPAVLPGLLFGMGIALAAFALGVR
jgi:hypothetical protein